jgi:hypothetical protein
MHADRLQLRGAKDRKGKQRQTKRKPQKKPAFPLPVRWQAKMPQAKKKTRRAMANPESGGSVERNKIKQKRKS